MIKQVMTIGLVIGMTNGAFLTASAVNAAPPPRASQVAILQQKLLRRQLAEKDAVIAALRVQIALLSAEVQRLRNQGPVVELPTVHPLVAEPGSSIHPLQFPSAPSPAASPEK